MAQLLIFFRVFAAEPVSKFLWLSDPAALWALTPVNRDLERYTGTRDRSHVRNFQGSFLHKK